MTEKEQRMQSLYQLIADIHDPKDIEALLEDLCTRKEVAAFLEKPLRSCTRKAVLPKFATLPTLL